MGFEENWSARRNNEARDKDWCCFYSAKINGNLLVIRLGNVVSKGKFGKKSFAEKRIERLVAPL